MTLNLMRGIDFWLGIPLTFLLTIVDRLRRLVGLSADPGDAQRHKL